MCTDTGMFGCVFISLPKDGAQEPVSIYFFYFILFTVAVCFSVVFLCVNINDCSRLSLTHFHPTHRDLHIIYFRMTLVSKASAP